MPRRIPTPEELARAFFGSVADEIIRALHPSTVFDAGCALGMLVESLWDRGVHARGVDISTFAIENVRHDMRPYCRVGSLTDPIEGRYDLIACIDVLEHLLPGQARHAIANMTAASDAILFSSSPSEFNVQPVIAWIEQFGEFGFAPDLAFNASFLCPRAILFRKTGENAEDSEADLARLRQDLQQIYSSPGWQLIMRYRRWLQDRRGKSRFLTRYVEPLVNSAIRRTRIGSVSTPLPAASPERAVPVLAAGFGSGGAYESWWARTEPGPGELQLQSAMARQFRLQPVISVLVPVYKVPLEVLYAMVDSVRNQTYHAWELCILHAFPEDTAARQYLSDLAAKDSRIKVQLAVENRGISQNSNAALKLVTGEYVALLDHDDTLAPSALYQIARLIIEKPDVDFIYSDKDLLTEDGTRRMNPLFKPQWSPDIMLSANYLTHLCVMRAEHVRASGGWKAETDGAQDWDIFLRVMQLSRSILHLPKVLYHWRAIKTSVAAGMAAKPYASAAQLRTINHHLARIGVSGEAVFNRAGALKVEWGAMAQLSASIVLVSAGPASRLESRARAIEKGTKHPSFEILAVGPGLTAGREGRIRWIPASPGEPLGALLNKAARLSNSACLVFLDDAVEPGRGPWLSELVGPLQQKDVAIVGAKLIDPFTMNIRHAGIVFNRDGKPDYIFAGEPEHVCAEFGGGYWYRNWSAISGACFAVRREVFDDVGGFAESPEYPRLDIDLCLQVRLKRDLRIFYNPFARFKQGRSALIESWPYEGAEEAGAAFIRSIFASGDPYFHPELESREGKVLFSSPQRSIPPGTDYAADARALTAGFDFRDSDIRHSLKVCSVAARHEVRNITWVLPEFTHAFYGGIYTILRFADYFRRAHGVRSNFLVLGQCPEGVMRSRIAEPFPELGRDCGVIRLTGYGQIDSAPATDATIATLWTTAYAALRFSHTRRKFYFMQDYETLFYPAGSINALVEATYRFGFYGICNTRSLRDTYASLGGRAEYFDPSIDPSVFFPPAEPKPGKPYTIFCYARPGHARNCFEMLMAAMRKVKQTFGEDIRIVAAGAEWDPALYGLGGIVENLGLLGYRATGALYRTCDAGVAMMMTRHPSYLPMELMVCGALVVTNHNPYTTWLLKDEENCLLSETSASAVAEALTRGLTDRALRERIIANAFQMVKERYSNWDKEAEKIYQYMVTVC